MAGVGAGEGDIEGAEWEGTIVPMTSQPQLGSAAEQQPVEALQGSLQVLEHELLLQPQPLPLWLFRAPNNFSRRPLPHFFFLLFPQDDAQGSAAQLGSVEQGSTAAQVGSAQAELPHGDPQGSAAQVGSEQAEQLEQELALQDFFLHLPPKSLRRFRESPFFLHFLGLLQDDPQGSAAQVGSHDEAAEQGSAAHVGSLQAEAAPQGSDAAAAQQLVAQGSLHDFFVSQQLVEQPQPFAPSIWSRSSKL